MSQLLQLQIHFHLYCTCSQAKYYITANHFSNRSEDVSLILITSILRVRILDHSEWWHRKHWIHCDSIVPKLIVLMVGVRVNRSRFLLMISVISINVACLERYSVIVGCVIHHTNSLSCMWVKSWSLSCGRLRESLSLNLL